MDQASRARRIAHLVLMAALPLVLAACPAAGGGPAVELKGQQFTVEIADDLEEQTRGLMFRRELADDQGMLFVYPQAQTQSFWMKNCYVPLDIMFFDSEAHLVNAHYNVPVCRGDPCPTYSSERPARYVLELRAGVGKALGLAPGDPIKLPGAPWVTRPR